MNKKQQQEQWIDDALGSLDNATGAQPRPFLFTRLHAKMNAKKESVWDTYLQFLSKPAVAVACVGMIIAVNTMVISSGYSGKHTETTVDDEQYAALADDDEATSLFNNNENPEP